MHKDRGWKEAILVKHCAIKCPLQVSVWFSRSSGTLVMRTTLWSSTAQITVSPFRTAEPTCIAPGQRSPCWCHLQSTGSDGETLARPTSACWVRNGWQKEVGKAASGEIYIFFSKNIYHKVIKHSVHSKFSSSLHQQLATFLACDS